MSQIDTENVMLAVLLHTGEPVSFIELSNKLGIALDRVVPTIWEINRRLKDLPMRVVMTDQTARLAIRKEYTEFISQFNGVKVQKLSEAATETLAVIAWKQPVTRQEIEAIRDVDCEQTIDTLIKARLIKPLGNMKQQGRPTMYAITEECLYRFGFKSYGEMIEAMRPIFEQYGITGGQ